jgi:hypothetical protein
MYLALSDLEDFARGATLLGSGGGGETRYDLLQAEQYIAEYGPVKLLRVDELGREDLVVPCSFMGAPLVSCEMVPSGREFDLILREIEKVYRKKPTAIVAAEIGGSNGLAAVWVAARARLPLVDGDLIGRAFPRLEMNSATLRGLAPSYSFLADGGGRLAMCCASSGVALEKNFRSVCQEFGSSAALASFVMAGSTARNIIIEGSCSRAMMLGRGKLLNFVGEGVVVAIDNKIDGGFLFGSIEIEGTRRFRIEFQNEFLALFEWQRAKKIPIVLTPDIIALIEAETAMPLSVESVRFGMKVKIATLEAPAIWKSPEGLALVGPRVFGYTEKEDYFV